MENRRMAIFLNPFAFCSLCKRKLSVCKWTKQTEQTHPSMLKRFCILEY